MEECCGEYIVEDQHTGDSICSGCGKVFSSFHTQQWKSDPQIQDSCFMEKCARGEIPLCIALYAQDCLTLKNTDCADRAYCLYQACDKLGSPRSIKEISKILNLSKKSRAKFSQKCNREIISPSTLAERVCKRLEIHDFKLISKIATLSDHVYEENLLSSPPQSILAGCIALQCPSQPVQSIANECGVSTSCVMRASRAVRSACGKRGEFYGQI
jgi:transcription initiation factor TFIIIB Brf1 subunit/transcription initiation factor TFIIB